MSAKELHGGKGFQLLWFYSAQLSRIPPGPEMGRKLIFNWSLDKEKLIKLYIFWALWINSLYVVVVITSTSAYVGETVASIPEDSHSINTKRNSD